MAEFFSILIVVLISGFAIILGCVLLLGAMGVVIGKAVGGDDGDWLSRLSWLKVSALAFGMLLLLAMEIAAAGALGVFKDDASLHCGPGTTYHYAYKGRWTCELQ